MDPNIQELLPSRFHTSISNPPQYLCLRINNTSSTIKHLKDHSLANCGTKCQLAFTIVLFATRDCSLTIINFSQIQAMLPSGELSIKQW